MCVQKRMHTKGSPTPYPLLSASTPVLSPSVLVAKCVKETKTLALLKAKVVKEPCVDSLTLLPINQPGFQHYHHHTSTERPGEPSTDASGPVMAATGMGSDLE